MLAQCGVHRQTIPDTTRGLSEEIATTFAGNGIRADGLKQ